MHNERPAHHPGDDGRSDLLSPGRPPKNDPVFECLGWLDELTAALGTARVSVRQTAVTGMDSDLRAAQAVLGRVMTSVAARLESENLHGVTDADLAALEELERTLRAQTHIEPRFFIPGDTTPESALADAARARCRTAERALVAFMNAAAEANAPGRGDLAMAQRYLNRLSDYLFVVARHLDGASRQGPDGRQFLNSVVSGTITFV